MGSKASKAKRPTPAKSKAVPQNNISIPPQDTVPISPGVTAPVPLQDTIPFAPQDTTPITSHNTIPRIPHDIITEILDHLASDSDLQTLRACALVSGSWLQPCQRRLFHTAHFTPTNACRWLETFPVQEVSHAHHVRDLRLEIGQVSPLPEKFFECIPWFTDVDRISFLGYGGVMLGNGSFSPLWDPSFWKLLRSVTSLTINTGVVTLVQVRDIMAQLPNLDNLVFSGFSQVYGRMFPGIGTVLKGRFCGRLLLNGPCARAGIISMLLEIPSGLHFSELEIHCARNGPHSSFIRLAEACGGTLVKLLHSVSSQYCDSSERSFDFSKFPNIQEVMFGFTTFWMGGSFPWIPMALSTLRPATSPRLSVIKLYFHSLTGEPGQTLIPDLRRIADEITRIEREFEGAVNFTVAPDPGFRALFKTFDILQHRIR